MRIYGVNAFRIFIFMGCVSCMSCGDSSSGVDGETGFLVDPDGRVDAVVNQLLSLASDRSLLRPMRIRARGAVLRRFTAQRSALNKLAVYQRMSGTGHA